MYSYLVTIMITVLLDNIIYHYYSLYFSYIKLYLIIIKSGGVVVVDDDVLDV